jgi:hypothetical protein
MRPKFTLAESNAMLPLVKAIAREIVERRTQRKHLQQMRREVEEAATPEGLAHALAELDARIFELDDGIRNSGSELGRLGLTVLRPQPLTIHFPGRSRGGDLVFCWQEGEDSVRFGHERGEEEDPRRPLRVRSSDQVA